MPNTPHFDSLGLAPNVLRGVNAAGYTTPTPIQAQAIPPALAGRDLIGVAQTGTGKTAGFVLPMLSRLIESAPERGFRHVRCLIVTPTRELAMQVEEAIREYGRYADLRSISIFGGTGYGAQTKALKRGVDIVVATPGRLLDHLDSGALDLSRIEVLVLDEADRMLDMGFIRDIRKIADATPHSRQTLLFSATMPDSVQKFARELVDRDAETVAIGTRTNPADTVEQRLCRVRAGAKLDLLIHIIEEEDADNVIVFSRTKHRADRIARKLKQRGYAAVAMHSNRSQRQRERALEGFRDGTHRILVATDIAARGIDVERVSHVVNHDTPRHTDAYIHRIGRTGRAEETGIAVTFVSEDEREYLQAIEKHTGQRLPLKVYPGFDGHEEHNPNAPLPPKKKQTQNGGRGRGGNRRNGGGGRSGGRRRR